MASVSNLDADMKRLRMARYTPGASKEIRAWIEDTLGETIPQGDILDVLKDGTILCRLANLGLPPPGIKFKKSNMPFIQMENISHFLTACEKPPFNLPSHDRFLTVDLFEAKDPAQVLQCLSAFSRVSNTIFPNKYPTAIGPKRGGAMSPTHTGASNGSATSDYSNSGRSRGLTYQHTGGPASPPRSNNNSRPMSTAFLGQSSILYSGYMGGASQGNQGISFGARRQLTTPGPFVPSLAEKERKRREKEADDEKLRELAEEAEAKRQVERAAEEERDRIAEERRWEDEAQKQREEEKKRVERQKLEWEEQEQKWKEAEEERMREERDAQQRDSKETQRRRGLSDARLRGQYLSEYQTEQTVRSRQTSYNDPERNAELTRIEDLERQLAEAKERERQYEEERQKRDERRADRKQRARSRSRPRPASRPPSPQESNVSWAPDEREYLRKQHSEYRNQAQPEVQSRSRSNSTYRNQAQPEVRSRSRSNSTYRNQTQPEMQSQSRSNSTRPRSNSTRPLPDPMAAPKPTARPLPEPTAPPPTSRPLPDPTAYNNANPSMNRTERFLSQNRAPEPVKPRSHYPAELGLTSESERRGEDTRRVASQTKTKAGGWAGKSLLEREMERERERQREWEASQKEARTATRDPNAGAGAGQSWDVNQYGYTGGDSQNKIAPGIGFGGKRQIIGPRPPP
ncbi:hypothetical protein BT63DRAFT_408970 [Microthyrium microscopicum]|uniref:Calponin-homology (CH) domain-containing protein n=1 Tax=Microthyrium microscopicum TaxID=703497 RepID=A0A6A6URC9_9PEZI|nr:hypothetical protein BT63DRAFT_408970 [Microthyrium microscopicum]